MDVEESCDVRVFVWIVEVWSMPGCVVFVVNHWVGNAGPEESAVVESETTWFQQVKYAVNAACHQVCAKVGRSFGLLKISLQI